MLHPRFARVQRFALVAVLSALAVPSLAQANPIVSCVREVVVKLRSPYENSPPNNTPPLVVKWPTPPVTPNIHHHEHHHPPPPPVTSPEQTSLLTGVLGSGLFALFAWWRKRMHPRTAEDMIRQGSVFRREDEPQLAMAA
jgi:hypothetical protein